MSESQYKNGAFFWLRLCILLTLKLGLWEFESDTPLLICITVVTIVIPPLLFLRFTLEAAVRLFRRNASMVKMTAIYSWARDAIRSLLLSSLLVERKSTTRGDGMRILLASPNIYSIVVYMDTTINLY